MAHCAADGHVTVSRRGRLHGPVDDALAERGLTRRVVAALPTSSAALDLAAWLRAQVRPALRTILDSSQPPATPFA
jgi:hypothetical protein